MENLPAMLEPTFIYKQHLDIDSITSIMLVYFRDLNFYSTLAAGTSLSVKYDIL